MSDTLIIAGNTYNNVAGFKATNSNNDTLTYVRPQGSTTISSNGTNIDVTQYATVDVAVPVGSTINNQNKTVTPTTASQSVTFDVDSNNYTGLGTVTVNAIPSQYITTTDADATAANILLNKTAYVNGVKITGEMANNGSTGGTISTQGGTYTIPAGYTSGGTVTASLPAMTLPTSATGSATSGYTSKATISRSTSDQYINIPTGYNSAGGYYKINAVANGTAGTPTATKSAVTNNSVTITPSVTNTIGYITGGTLNGTAVLVTASELVNGTLNIDDDGTYDVTNYASAEVNIDYSSKVISEITISSSGVVSQQLQPDTIYHFTSTALTDLTLTFASVTSTAQYHFDFISPSAAVNLTLPQSVNMPSNFTIEANTRYEIDVINNYGVFAEWVYEVS